MLGRAAGSSIHGSVQSNLIGNPQETGGTGQLILAPSKGGKWLFLDSECSRYSLRARGGFWGSWVAQLHLRMGRLLSGPHIPF